MKKLTTMTDFVLEQEKEFNNGILGFKEFTNNICNYANFLKKPLELWMFIPYDENGNVLSEKYSAKEDTENKSFAKLSNEYKQAKEKCLFDVFDIKKANIYIELFSNIESLSNLNNKIQLTQTAIKQIGL